MPAQPVPRLRGVHGFSVVELLVVLALVGVLLSLAAPRFDRMLSVGRAQGAVDRFSGDAALARIQAVRAGRSASLRILSATSYSVTLDNTDGTAQSTVKTVNLANDYPGVTIDPATGRISFDSRGMRKEGTGYVSSATLSRDGFTRTLAVSAVGRIYRAEY